MNVFVDNNVTIEYSLDLWRKVQEISADLGNDTLTLDEINSIIANAKRESDLHAKRFYKCI